ncbi:MAG TPA: hypothetical protein PKG49_05215 [Nitrosomonas mobilis]|nr:hypothetical protein [Nitrosomonas mobilis]
MFWQSISYYVLRIPVQSGHAFHGKLDSEIRDVAVRGITVATSEVFSGGPTRPTSHNALVNQEVDAMKAAAASSPYTLVRCDQLMEGLLPLRPVSIIEAM